MWYINLMEILQAFLISLIVLLSIFLAIAGISISFIFNSINETSLGGFPKFFGLIYFVFALIYLWPILNLYRFSDKSKKALAIRSNSELELAFKNLKNHYQFMGIFAIVMIVSYFLFFGVLIAGFGGAGFPQV